MTYSLYLRALVWSFPVDGCELADDMGTFQAAPSDPTCVVGVARDWDTLVVKRDMFGSIKFNRHETEALLQDRGIDALFLSAGLPTTGSPKSC
ncbi:hypothetical protein AK812_SmicGene931 [Symbiodinium microadriaticum]|uniref:Uncharacterized protein n=1 Tax=Symbiodinium microadriaticum TaxID=2951 RepID=A0A1Q9F5G9_SYMMI|nr:hypothetical protein AK812_SmicGene931 [Symbiodinium microadriaticum]